MRPWAQEWVVHPLDYRCVAELDANDPTESLTIADIRADEPPEYAALMAAAPDMARALVSAKSLIESLAAEDAVYPEYTAVCDALRKAGVPCP